MKILAFLTTLTISILFGTAVSAYTGWNPALCMGSAVILSSLPLTPIPGVLYSQIGTLLTGAGTVTTLNLQFVPQFILVGDTETDLPLTAMSWNIAGDELVNIGSAVMVQAYSKFGRSGLLGADVQVAQLIQVGDGYYGNQQFQLRLTNAGVTTPAIYGYSKRYGTGELITVSQNVILDGANQRYNGFVALQFVPTNVTRCDVEFTDLLTDTVYSESMSPVELMSMFVDDNTADASGLLGTLVTIDNASMFINDLQINGITIYASGANVTVNVIGVN